VARPKKNISEEQVLQLAAINCSYAEMGAVLDCDESTLTRRFAQVIQKGRETGKMSLKRKQWEVAMGGNVTMLIWLGKQNLGQTDKMEERKFSQVKSESSLDQETLGRLEKLTQAILTDGKA